MVPRFPVPRFQSTHSSQCRGTFHWQKVDMMLSELRCIPSCSLPAMSSRSFTRFLASAKKKNKYTIITTDTSSIVARRLFFFPESNFPLSSCLSWITFTVHHRQSDSPLRTIQIGAASFPQSHMRQLQRYRSFVIIVDFQRP